MKWYVKKIVACFLFLAILGFSFFKLNQLFLNKNFYNQGYPTTSCYANFYRMKKNSVDVLFFGTSHAVCSFYPQELYNKYNITSFNLGCEQQSLVVSYYWFLEALKYQKPKVVVIEPYLIFRANSSPLVTGEGLIRKSIDPMKFSKTKFNAVKDICAFDKKQRFVSYLIPSIRFHNRWKYLNEDDFSYTEMIAHEDAMGIRITNATSKKSYIPFNISDSEKTADVNQTQKEYIDKIIDVCKKNGINILIALAPCFGDISMHNTLGDYSKKMDVCFVDFNEYSIYTTINYNVKLDNYNDGHTNRNGAIKITDYIGKILVEDFGLQGHTDEQYELRNAYYQRVNENFDLTEITDINTYLEKINRERYSIFISVKDEASEGLSDNVLKKLSALGLRKSLKDKYRKSYCAVISGGKVIEEKLGDKKLSCTGSIRNGKSIYKIESAGYLVGNASQIIIDGKNHSKNRRGLNIVVYDNEQKKVIDSVCFDTCDKKVKAYR